LLEAQNLCTHGARAEMILKWLLERMLSLPEARVSSQTWNLFALCLRVLSGRRIAAVLGANEIVEILRRTCTEPNKSQETIFAIASCLDLMLTLAEPEDGAAIKSLLSIEDEIVAEICGCWFLHVYNSYGEEDSLPFIVNGNLLRPGIRLWELRRRTQAGDQSFTSHCLAPILLLLEVLKRSTSMNKSKRKRADSDPSPVADIACALERLVAKHSIARFRAKFSERPHKTDVVVTDYNPQQAQLGDVFEPLWRMPPGVEARQMAEVMPLLLDITIRSLKATTPNSRLRERPWIEAVFAVLHGCVLRMHSPTGSRPLVDMLQVIYRRSFTLSDNIIVSIIRYDALFVSSDDTSADWPLIAHICSVHPMPLTESSLANLVFGQISDEAVHGNMMTDKREMQNNSSEFIRHAVIRPIIGAFGSTRKLKSFVQLWSQQLDNTFESEHDLLWSEISVDFARVAAKSMTHAQSIEAVEHYSRDVIRMISTTSRSKDTSRELHTCFVLLSAFIQSARGESTLEQIQDLLDALRTALQSPAEPDAIVSSTKLRLEYTHLLDIIYRSWTPSWMMRQIDTTSVEDMAVQFVSSRAFEIVTDNLQNTNRPPKLATPTILASTAFLATICETFMPYTKLKTPGILLEKCLKYLNFSGFSKNTVLLGHPELFRSNLISARESGLVDRLELLDSVRDEHSQKQDVAPAAAFVDVVLGQEAGDRVCPPVGIFVQDLCARLTSNPDGKIELSLLSILDDVPLSIVTTQHRTHVVDTIAQLPIPFSGSNCLAIVERRLASLVRWLERGALDAKIVTDAACIWDMTRIPDVSEGQNQMNYATVYDLIERLTHIAFEQCQKIQDRKHVQDIFVEHSKKARSCILQLSSTSEPASIAHCVTHAVTKVALVAMEKETNDETKQLLVYRDPEILSTYLEYLRRTARLISSSTFERIADFKSMVDIFAAWDALVTIPESILQLISAKLANHGTIVEHHQQLTSYAQDILRKACHEVPSHANDKLETALWQRTIAQAHAVICQHAADDARKFSQLSLEILQLNLTVDSRAAILSNFGKAIRERPPAWKRLLLASLMHDKYQLSETGLLLQRSIIVGLTKDDLDEDSFNTNVHELLRRTIGAAKGCNGLGVAKTAMQSCATFLKEKPFIMTQFGIEEIVTALHEVGSTPTLLVILYLDLTQVMTVLLTHYRSRLQGRFHILVAIFQGLFSGIDQSTDQNSPRRPLAVRQARALARLLALFCDPPHLRHRNKSVDLVDEGRKEKGRVGQFLSSVLHHYCTQVLSGRDGPEVREALNPGVWAMIEAMESGNPEGIKVLSAALNNSERAVLRSLYDDWKRFGKWEGL
jgi:nucleolar pre-ribosomal-associated protein 2